MGVSVSQPCMNNCVERDCIWLDPQSIFISLKCPSALIAACTGTQKYFVPVATMPIPDIVSCTLKYIGGVILPQWLRSLCTLTWETWVPVFILSNNSDFRRSPTYRPKAKTNWSSGSFSRQYASCWSKVQKYFSHFVLDQYHFPFYFGFCLSMTDSLIDV